MTVQQLFQIVGQISEQTSMPIYVVGGFVRDRILKDKYGTVYSAERLTVVEENRIQAALQKDIIDGGSEVIIEPVTHTYDIDFAIEGSGIAFATALDNALAGVGSLVIFEQFDTARYVLDQFDIEFAGARKEAYDRTSRKPQVQEATIAEDLSRRDFTVNAMAQQIRPDGSLAEVIDLFGGIQDIEKKTLKTPLNPDETFSEDPLRMIRAARFAAKLAFEIEPETYAALKRNADRLSIVSKERILEEFLKLLGTPQPSIGLWILHQAGLFPYFLPEIDALDGVEETYGQTHKNNLSHTFRVVDNLATRTNKPLLRYAGLMHDIGKPGTKEFIKGRGWAFDMHEHLGRKIVRTVGKRLRMSKHDTEYVAHLVRWHQQPIHLMDSEVTDTPVRRLVVDLGDDIDDLLKLCRSDITTGNPNKLTRRLKNYDVLEARIIEVIEKDKLRAFQSPVRGEEIMQMCGLKAGPTIGKIKHAIEEAILEGEIPNEYEPARMYLDSIMLHYVQQAEDWERV
jgi:tRNA nucleotidyltransferase (CCA-adding enzyme)